MLSFRALFITEVCFGRLPQVAAIKHLSNFYLFPVSLQSSLFCLGFDHAQSQGPKPISRNGYSPDL